MSPAVQGGGVSLCFPGCLLGTGICPIFIDSSDPPSLDAIIRHINTLSGRNIDVAIPPYMLEEAVDAAKYGDTSWVMSFSSLCSIGYCNPYSEDTIDRLENAERSHFRWRASTSGRW